MSANCIIEMHDLNKKRFTSPPPQHETMRPRVRVAWSSSEAHASRPKILQSRLLAHQDTEPPHQLIHKLIRSKQHQVISLWVREPQTEKAQVETELAQLTTRMRSPKRRADFEQENQPSPFANKQHSPTLGQKNISHLADLSASQPTKVVESSTGNLSARTENINKHPKHTRPLDALGKRARRAKRAQQRAALSPRHRPASRRSKKTTSCSKCSHTSRQSPIIERSHFPY